MSHLYKEKYPVLTTKIHSLVSSAYELPCQLIFLSKRKAVLFNCTQYHDYKQLDNDHYRFHPAHV